MHLYLAVTRTRACAVGPLFARVRGRACLCYACWFARRQVPWSMLLDVVAVSECASRRLRFILPDVA